MADKSRKPGKRQRNGAENAPAEPDYDTLLLLERLESLLEEMEELGVSSRAEIEARIEALNQQLDAEEK
ncbi:MAG TPA: hypothetical protein VFU32_09865 [Ktedonobacterales bacterium]|nr:hypothetical protein [Ktedonobacterales bacterium]